MDITKEIKKIEYNGKIAYLKPMLIEKAVDGRPFKKRPTILVLPGGGYGFVSDREGEPVARYFNAAGFNCFVLRYTVNQGEACFPAPLYQAAKAVEYIRQNCDEFNVDPSRVFVMGFSAGGHLAAWLSNGCGSDLAKSLKIDETLSKPNGQVLCYPVITGEKGLANEGSFVNLFGCEDFRERSELPDLSCERMVTKNSPPAFIWQTVDDDIVPSENSLIMVRLSKGQGCRLNFICTRAGLTGCRSATRPARWCRRNVKAGKSFALTF